MSIAISPTRESMYGNNTGAASFVAFKKSIVQKRTNSHPIAPETKLPTIAIPIDCMSSFLGQRSSVDWFMFYFRGSYSMI